MTLHKYLKELMVQLINCRNMHNVGPFAGNGVIPKYLQNMKYDLQCDLMLREVP